jgi:DNA-binding LytR/AlgR family response regulator
LVRDEIENMMNRLPSYFIRVHKSYIINSKIISGHKFPNYILCNGYTVPIGEKFKDDVKTILQVKLDFVP